jgi:2-keto-4-pentenoate hydratase/2-oxohepta-3-ene-1,7-dioic acid hydratase in catechol pathway
MKIICVGRNYTDHIKELGNSAPEAPVLFLKPATALLKENLPFYHPEFSSDIHHELELVVRIEKNGKSIAEKFAHKYYTHVSLGIDFTARDLQADCKKKGLPWEISKAFDHSAVIGEFVELSKFPDWQEKGLEFSLLKNGTLVQKANHREMLNSIDAVIAYASQFFTLQKGDLLYTGTPAGVSRVQIGDVLEGFLFEQALFRTEIK